MVCLLETYHTVEAVLSQLVVFLGLQRHHLYLNVREILLGYVDSFGKIGHASLGRILSCHEEYVLKGCQFLYCLVLILYLFGRENGARHGV